MVLEIHSQFVLSETPVESCFSWVTLECTVIPDACGVFYLNSVYPWLLSLSVGRMVLLPYDCVVLFPSGCLSV